MGLRAWWRENERRRRWNLRQERASDAKFYTLLVGFVFIAICVIGDWLNFWNFFNPE